MRSTRTAAEVGAIGLPIEGGVFRDINSPVIGTDVNDDGTFADVGRGQELVRFPDVDWDGEQGSTAVAETGRELIFPVLDHRASRPHSESDARRLIRLTSRGNQPA